MGRRSVSRVLWSVRCLLRGDPNSYRFFSHARWSLWPLAKVLAALVLEGVPKDQPVLVLAADMVDQHRGNHVCSAAAAGGTATAAAGGRP